MQQEEEDRVQFSPSILFDIYRRVFANGTPHSPIPHHTVSVLHEMVRTGEGGKGGEVSRVSFTPQKRRKDAAPHRLPEIFPDLPFSC